MMTLEEKSQFLSLPRPYAQYGVRISTQPHSWGCPITSLKASEEAARFGELLKSAFPGISIVLSDEPNTYPFGGEDPDVLVEIEDWMAANFKLEHPV